MEIKNIKSKPYEKSVLPGISFDVEISYEKYTEAIVNIGGWLATDDEKVVAEIKEEVIESVRKPPRSNDIGARSSAFDKEFKEDIYKTTLVAPLSREALNYIEKKRKEDRKGDVNLTLILNLKTINSKALISHVYGIRPQDIGLRPINIPGTIEGTLSVLLYALNPEYSSPIANRWLLSGDGKPVFLGISEQTLKGSIRIPSTDWIHDYAPKLGLGEYFVVEIPKGKEVIKEAWSYVEKAEESFRNWNIEGVYANCRDAGNLLNKEMERELGKESFAYNERWGRAYLKFFNYLVSLGLHLEDMKGKNWEELIKNLPEGFPHPKRYADYPVEELKRFGRPDAEYVLTATKLLIKYAEELLEEKHASITH